MGLSPIECTVSILALFWPVEGTSDMTAQEEEQKRLQPIELLPALQAAPRLEPPIPSEPDVAPSRAFVFGEPHSEFASFHEGYVRHYIALADTKAGVIFTLAAGVIGYPARIPLPSSFLLQNQRKPDLHSTAKQGVAR